MVNCSTPLVRYFSKRTSKSSQHFWRNTRTRGGLKFHYPKMFKAGCCRMNSMMDFSMPCCTKRLNSILFGVLLLFASTAFADGIVINKAEARLDEDGYQLTADFNIRLNYAIQRINAALSNFTRCTAAEFLFAG